MTRSEIKRKFDEIVAFAEIEKYLDTPVKRYSSGMYVRLAFAVAAHLEPEILVVDEVLAVGDAQFQKKCLGKMEHMTKENRTVLFVSHNMPTIEALCKRGIILVNGFVDFDDNVADAVNKYLTQHRDLTTIPISERKDRQGFGRVIIETIEIGCKNLVATGNDFTVEASYRSLKGDINITEFGMSIWSANDVRLISLSSQFCGGLENIPHSGKIKCVIKKLPLVKGDYFLNFFVSSTHGIEDYILHAVHFYIEDSNFFGTGKSVDPKWGYVAVEHQWLIPKQVNA
jgi:lipopolysaccharide transport system ATP-binding protein